ncbi:MAG: response regulator, partial [Eubacterium sp.]|nr:response regulator [Eubacterium sp.]
MIYVLEDDESVRELEMYALSGNGYEVSGFAEPKSLYSALEKRKPDLLVIDVMLPEEDGLSITKKLRNNPKYRDMPIVMVTAKDSEMDYVKGLDCGAD